MTIHRTVEWGHWGITFATHEIDASGQRGYSAHEIYGTQEFPVGARGPADGLLGSPEREAYKRMCTDWTARGVLPSGLERPNLDEATGGAAIQAQE